MEAKHPLHKDWVERMHLEPRQAPLVAMARIQTAEITFENVAICCPSKRASLE